MSETPATATCAAWSNLNGQVTCPAHAPTSLAAALERAPRAQQIRTDDDLWTRITAEDLQLMAAYLNDPD
ncbi:hypothetical protein KM868_10120 [Micrococcus luteus]|uniref:hypothetical protein n=2 Tax=Micrococcaceae TaxID=1268 RepID=UPI00128E8471|nr:hypothetical protein [Micrococcus luteus]MBU8763852.1 hypothetical protein [Micrococcus luteus]MCV7495883.1 hypothetical protein [Micrococcus luteus]MPZ02737.1 hypothetical protein [Micrococcus luteus]